MTQVLKNCPNCHEGMSSSAEMAAHRCPEVYRDVNQEVLRAAARAELEARRKIRPTRGLLAEDCRKVCEQLHEFWDGEVLSVVIMVPRDGGDAAGFTTVEDSERYRAILDAFSRAAPRRYSAPRGPMLME
jgi:hypothetical protein